MCNIIVINKGEKEIGTPREFLEYFGYEAEKEDYHDKIELDCCLCQVDLDATFIKHNVPYLVDCGDYFIGDLTNIKDE